jgi:phosphatidylglycerol---prolipoprotein diacylglyceryl transferase
VYADFAELLKRLFGINWPVFSLFKTFGFLVAMSFFAAGYTLFLELKRKHYNNTISKGYLQDVTIDTRINYIQYLISTIIGFVVGYKFIGMMLAFKEAAPDPLHYIGSTKGNLLAGIVIALSTLISKYIADKKEQKIYAGQEMPITKKVRTPHYFKVGDIGMIAAISGFVGAKLFNALETWDQFIADPIGSLISSSGLTFYGGLILATISLYYYTRKWGLNFRQLCDACAPGLILAYGIGRLGCQVSGDGDWGIFNSAYVTNIQGQAVPAQDSNAFEMAKAQYQSFFNSHYQDFKETPHKSIIRPAALSFMPHWMFAYSYPNNVNNVGIPLAGCTGDYCAVLPVPVFPTPLYEFLAGCIIFLILWKLRKKLTKPLDLFGVYLILNGLERYLIEQIRVNTKYNIGAWHPTQAELIAMAIALIGVIMIAINRFTTNKLPIENSDTILN